MRGTRSREPNLEINREQELNTGGVLRANSRCRSTPPNLAQNCGYSEFMYFSERPRNRGYDKQQVCLNGHIVTNYGTTHPEDLKKFCSECGEATILACPACQTSLRGAEIDPDVVVIGFGCPPAAYCPECGKGFPWTERKFDVAMELAELVEKDSRELERLRESLNDLATETPRTPLAVARVKSLLAKGGKIIGPSIGKVLTDIASEAVQKQLGLK